MRHPTDVVGLITDAKGDRVLCPECFEGEGWPREDASAIFRSDEADTPTHCERCDGLIRHGLTPDGIEYVREAVEDHADTGKGCHGPSVIDLWREEYLPE